MGPPKSDPSQLYFDFAFFISSITELNRPVTRIDILISNALTISWINVINMGSIKGTAKYMEYIEK